MALVFLSLISFFGINFSQKKPGLFQRLLAISLALTVLLAWTGNPYLSTTSVFLQMLLGMLTGYYGISQIGLSFLERGSIISMGLFMAILRLFYIYQFPYADVLIYFSIIPFFLFLYTWYKDRTAKKKEFGFMLIWSGILFIFILNFYLNY